MSTKADRFLEELLGGPLTFGEAVATLRDTRELSMAAFAEELGISRSHLNDIEKGRKGVSPERAARFAEVLGHSERLFVKLALADMLRRAGLNYEVELTAKNRGRAA